jgi:hypothetical protein
MTPFFLPTKYRSEYYRRLDYPNPGRNVWYASLKTVGYEPHRVYNRIDGLEWADRIVGNHYHGSIEGIGGRVFTFAKAASGRTSP